MFVGLVLGCSSKAQESSTVENGETMPFAVQKTEAEWREILTPEEYYVLREDGTEPRFSSPILSLDEAGYLTCAACGNPVFKMEHKFDSSCGWPSFDRAIDGAVRYVEDYKLWVPRIEVICAQCGSHLGHVFEDGPKETTGKRYCIDGIALNFIPQKSSEKQKKDK